MIPPLKEIRLRSISRWLKDQQPQQFKQLNLSGALDSHVNALDERMLEEFESREDSLKASMMQAGTWGTEQGLTSFPTDRMTLWQEVVSEFLPPTTDQPLEA